MNAQAQETKSTTLANLRPQPEQDVKTLPAISVGLTSLQGFELAQRAAKLLASSTLVPKDYQNNLSNCVVALNMAARVGADPLMVMQNLVVVHGRPTWSSQFLIATVNTCGRFSALRYEFFGKQGEDGWGCRAWAIEKATGEKLVGTDVTIGLAKAEGWYNRNGSKWKTMPQQMLMYRAAGWWARAYAPELSMGLHTAEEIGDVFDASRDEAGNYVVDLGTLRGQTPPHDPATGELLNGSQPGSDAGGGDATQGDPQPEAPKFDVNRFNLNTQQGIREATKALCTQLELAPADQRAAMFLQNSGQDIVSAAGRAGLGTLKQRFVDLGINLTAQE